MDLHTMVWTVRLCFALQRHHGDHFLSLEKRTLVIGHSGPHPWKRELRSWLDRPNKSLDSSACDEEAPISTSLYCFGFVTSGGGFNITY